jgi:hypothetical protein
VIWKYRCAHGNKCSLSHLAAWEKTTDPGSKLTPKAQTDTCRGQAQRSKKLTNVGTGRFYILSDFSLLNIDIWCPINKMQNVNSGEPVRERLEVQ